MKKFLLFAAMIAVGLMSNAQTLTFNDAYPDGWIVNREIKLAKYDNPLTRTMDTGMLTAAINYGPTDDIHMLTTGAMPYMLTSNMINVSFDAFAFRRNAMDFDLSEEAAFRCNSQVKAFLVRASYTSNEVPTGAEIVGQSDYKTIVRGNNTLNIQVNNTFVPGDSYRILFAGRVAGACSENEAQYYIFDNVLIGNTFFTQDFESGTFPGLELTGGLTIGKYNTEGRGCGDNMGLITPAITTTEGIRVAAPIAVPLANVSAINFKFNLFAYNANANFECAAAQQSLNCTTTLKIYIIDADNNPTGPVPTGTIYGQSNAEVIGVGANNLSVRITTPLVAGRLYKFYGVTNTTNCSGNAQRYVLDDLAVLNEFEEEDFDDVFPAGWDFAREVKITQYEVPGACTVDVGLVTPPIAGNVQSAYVATSEPLQFEASRPIIRVGYDLFPFSAEAREYNCTTNASTLVCTPSVKVYLVPASYSSTSVPTGSNNLGESEWVPASVGTNGITINVRPGITLNSSASYRLIGFGRLENCGGANAQVYVIDNISISETPEAILPVTFTKFNAKRNKNKVELTWETASEENNRGFHVQRNVDGTWKNIGFVFSQATGGNSTSALSYSFNDANTSRGISQYRLLQVDHDNKGKYSEVRSVRGEEQLSKIMVYPNPSNTGNINVMFDDASSLRDVFVTDVAGRVVKQYRNVNTNLLTIENLVDGYYTIQITNRTTAATTVEKVIIKKR